ncbi:MAG: gliding motility protein GldM [Cytophagaceae bacterium]|nr:gliding motility protein GldM [Cytophagaceae bacterium]
MMYLVLTALLALQVSSAIMEKFKFLDDSLQFANENTDKGNIQIEKKIEKTVTDGGNKATDLAVLEKAKSVRKEAEEIKQHIDKLRKEIIEVTGGFEDGDPKKMYKGAKEEEKVAVMMMGTGKQGKGYQLQKEVNQFVADVNKALNKPGKYKNIALDAKEDPRITSDDQKRKDFVELNFVHTPMVAAMAVLSNLESEVLKVETTALEELASEVGAADLKFDQVIAMVRPASKVVAAGTKYEAEMFLAASASTITPTMKARGANIPVDSKTKLGKVTFTAQGGAYDKEGLSKQSWSGEVTFKFKGKDTTFTVKEEYFVAKPVIQIQSASVSALYRNCGNELNVQVPALGSTYSPSFRAEGADVIPGTQKGLVTLIPTGTKVNLKVSSNGNYIGDQSFNVRLVPKPEIQALSNGKPVDEKQGMAAPGPRSITMKAVPDESFKTFLPKDARYRVAEWDCILVRGKRPVQQQKVTSETANLASFAAAAVPGDRILIEVKSVIRTNYQNKTENVNLGTVIKNIPLH